MTKNSLGSHKMHMNALEEGTIESTEQKDDIQNGNIFKAWDMAIIGKAEAEQLLSALCLNSLPVYAETS